MDVDSGSSSSSSDSPRFIAGGSTTSSQAPPIFSEPPQRQGGTISHANFRSRNHGGGPSHNTLSRPSIPGTRPIGAVGSSQRNNSRRGGYGAPRPHGYRPYNNNHGDRQYYQYMPHPPLPPMGIYMSSPPISHHYMPRQMWPDVAPLLPTPPSISPPFRPLTPCFAPPLPPISNESSLTRMIVNQIDYYFSNDNLAKDIFLRSSMDDYGWVSIDVVASFPRVREMTKDVPFIIRSLGYSNTVELEGEMMRGKNNWKKWIHSVPSPDQATTSNNVEEGHTKMSTNASSSEAASDEPSAKVLRESTNGENIAEESLH